MTPNLTTIFNYSFMQKNTVSLSFTISILFVSMLFICVPALSSDLLVPTEYSTLQQAIDAAYDGDRILIEPGIYTGIGFLRVSFEGREITVQGDSSETCIIDCEFMDRAFDFHCGENEFSVLRDIQIVNGIDECST